MDDAPNAWFALIRRIKECAAACLENGWTVEATRAMLLERGMKVLPDGPVPPDSEPLRSWVGGLLTRAVDETIFRTMARIHEGA